MTVDTSKLNPISDRLGDSDEDSALLLMMAKRAREYVESFDWCDGVEQQYFGIGVGGVVAVFLCKIHPANSKVADWLWVVVGDIPSAYLVTDDAPTPARALLAYVREMTAWVDAAKTGSPVEGLIPVNVPATPAWGTELERRLLFIQKKIISRSSRRQH